MSKISEYVKSQKDRLKIREKFVDLNKQTTQAKKLNKQQIL